jgi:hypothetical protein
MSLLGRLAVPTECLYERRALNGTAMLWIPARTSAQVINVTPVPSGSNTEARTMLPALAHLTLRIAIGAEHAAVSGFRFKQSVTGRAFPEIEAAIVRHRFGRDLRAVRTRNPTDAMHVVY